MQRLPCGLDYTVAAGRIFIFIFFCIAAHLYNVIIHGQTSGEQ